jgi:AAA domain
MENRPGRAMSRAEPPLDRREVRQVLGYWLAALRAEQALASRPRAVRPAASARAGDSPRSQTYFRLGAEHAPFMVAASGSAAAPIDDALLRFVEHWMARTRRRAQVASAGGEARRTTWVLGWPTLLLEQREEIATLLRFAVDIEWREGERRWDPFDRDRPLMSTAQRPDQVVVRVAEMTGEDGEPLPVPISVDRSLLHHALGVADDDIVELERRWAAAPDPTAMAADLLRLLGGEPAADAGGLFAALVAAARAAATRGISVYPAAIVQDGELMFATYHLQNDLRQLRERPPSERPLVRGSALSSYLTGQPASAGEAPLRARFRPRGVTASQRAAAERFLGSTLTAVQGPPGTGKTELILNLAAQAVVERAVGVALGATMGSGLLVVTSTNNRAVDNVIDPLAHEMPGERLPIALRTGNQEVTASRTARELERAREWLARQGTAAADERLERAREAFLAASQARDQVAAPALALAAHRSRLAELRRDLAVLAPPPARAPGSRRARISLRAELVRLQRMAAVPGKKQLRRLEQHWSTLAAGPLAAEVQGLPPPVDPSWPVDDRLEAWQDAIEEALDHLEAAAEAGKNARRDARRRAGLERELAALEAEPEPPPLDDDAARQLEPLGHALFLAALDLRERWAVATRDELLPALDAAIRAAVGQRSLRRLLSGERAGRAGLRALYPVLGCTLLSLGGSFELDADAIDRLVIDEAGQCHPAYAVSGLARARRALLIGDVHQLPPVVELSARDEARVQRDAGVTMRRERLEPYRVYERGESSAQALADRAVPDRPSLSDHFRCQPPIIGLCDEMCGYRLAVHTAPRSRDGQAASLRAPLLFAAVDGTQIRARGSWSNAAEADRLVALLLELGAAGIDWSEIGVMSPYVGQVDLLRGRLRAAGIPFAAASADLAEPDEVTLFGSTGRLSMGTVHRFQGGERSIVLFSTVVTDPRSLPFLDDRVNLLNVAVSRARDHLVTFGFEPALRAGIRTRLLVERAARM